MTDRASWVTPPIAFPCTPRALTTALDSRVVPVDEALVSRLRSACPDVDDTIEARSEAGRDWWPLGIRWAVEGKVPARPEVVARPASSTEVASVLAICHEARLPVTAMAGRSGVCGGSVPVFGGVALDLGGIAGLVDVDETSLVVDVAAGTNGSDLEQALNEGHSMTLGHWPQSIELSTVGGWLACRSAGQYSTRYGKIEDMVMGLEVALADGRLVRTGGTGPRAAMGPDLTQLFVGSEGVLGVVTEARLRAHPRPSGSSSLARGFGSFASGLDACRRILLRGATPAVLRLYDEAESKRNFDVTGRCVLIVLDEGDPVVVDAAMQVVEEECRSSRADELDGGLVDRWLEHRNDVSALAALTERGIMVDTVEVAGRWSSLPGLYAAAVSALRAIDGTIVASAHQSHSYVDGACLYLTFAGQKEGSDLEWAEGYYRSAWNTVMAAAVERGAAISHHHGVGLNRSRFLADALGPAYDVLVSVKQALDPHGVLNPGKLGLASPFGPPPWP
jgi:alkyldihydroxyacetonephosphate synthase